MSHSVTANYTLPTVLDTTLKSASATAKAITANTDTSTTSTSSSTDSSDIGTTFLNLLVKELQNQDPTDPVDSTAMVGQMISLNQLDQLISINDTLSGTTATASSATGAANGLAKSAATSTGSATDALTQSAATSQLPFDINTLMPLSAVSSNDATAAIANLPVSTSSTGTYGSTNSISGGK